MTEMTLDKLPKKVLAKIDLQTAFMASRCVVAAERLQVFRKLHGKELSGAAIGKKTGIRGWRLEAFLAALLSLGLLKKSGNLYRNSPLADKYYVRDRSIHWTKLYSEECVEEYQAFSVLEDILTTGKDYETILGIKRKYYLELMEENPQWAWDFTHMLYYDHQPEAKALAMNLDLSKYKSVLDVGGGSGVMSMALVRKNNNLKACVFDIESVIRVTKKIIKKERLAKRIDTCIGDMNKHIPTGYDVIMYCDAGSFTFDMFKTTYDALPPGGIVVLVENFSTEDWTEPLYRLMWQLRSKRFWLVSRQQVMENLRRSGFRTLKSQQILKGVWMITGRK